MSDTVVKFVPANNATRMRCALRSSKYENNINKTIFGQFLESCLKANKEEQIIKEIVKLSNQNIKGLGPAVANIFYFIHPTIIPPFNTSIVKGFNELFGEKKKLGD